MPSISAGSPLSGKTLPPAERDVDVRKAMLPTARNERQVCDFISCPLSYACSEAACRERNTRTSKSSPSAFISSCNLADGLTVQAPGLVRQLNQQMIQSIERCCQCWIVIAASRFAGRSGLPPKDCAPRRAAGRPPVAAIGMFQFHQQPLRAVQMIAQNHHHDALGLGTCATAVVPVAERDLCATVCACLCSHSRPPRKAQATSGRPRSGIT